MQGREYVRAKLAEHCLTQAWLTHQLTKEGLDTSRTSVSLALSGSRRGEAYQQIIKTSISILNYYETAMNSQRMMAGIKSDIKAWQNDKQ